MHIKLFGKMNITDGETTVRQEQFHSRKMILLLAYLLKRTDRCCTTRELVDALWMDRELASSEGALKNLVYRARRILGEAWPGEKLVLTVGGGYRWNPKVPVKKDTDELERLIGEAKKEREPLKREELLRQAVALYGDKLLEDFDEPFWITYEQTYFRNRFVEAVLMLAELLEKQGRYEELHKICRTALTAEPDEPSISKYLVRREPGWTETGSWFTGNTEDVETRRGALCCEPDIFRDLCRLQLYRKKRDSIPAVMVTLRLEDEAGDKAGEEVFDIIRYNIRIGDALTQSRDGQYMFLLYDCRDKDVRMIIERIKDRYARRFGRPPQGVRYEVFAI